MHIESDRATYWQTMANITGHSVRYLQVRACVRAAWVAACMCIPFASILATK